MGFFGGGGEEEFDGEMDELNSSLYENSILDFQTTEPPKPPPPAPPHSHSLSIFILF